MESKEDNKPFDWMSILPSIEELNLRAEKEKEADEKVRCYKTKKFIEKFMCLIWIWFQATSLIR